MQIRLNEQPILQNFVIKISRGNCTNLKLMFLAPDAAF